MSILFAVSKIIYFSAYPLDLKMNDTTKYGFGLRIVKRKEISANYIIYHYICQLKWSDYIDCLYNNQALILSIVEEAKVLNETLSTSTFIYQAVLESGARWYSLYVNVYHF